MTTLTMQMIKGVFVVIGPDIEPKKFKTRAEARDWCKVHYPGSPIREVARSCAPVAGAIRGIAAASAAPGKF